MTEAVIGLIGLSIGALAGWAWVVMRMRPAQMKQAAELKRRASLAEILRDELYAQNERKDRELVELRNHVDAERRKGAEIQTQLAAAQGTITAQQQHLEETTKHFTQKLEGVGTTLSEMISQSYLELAHFQDVGKSLETAIEAHKRAVALAEARVLAAARVTKETGSPKPQESSAKAAVVPPQVVPAPTASNEPVLPNGQSVQAPVQVGEVKRRWAPWR